MSNAKKIIPDHEFDEFDEQYEVQTPDESSSVDAEQDNLVHLPPPPDSADAEDVFPEEIDIDISTVSQDELEEEEFYRAYEESVAYLNEEPVAEVTSEEVEEAIVEEEESATTFWKGEISELKDLDRVVDDIKGIPVAEMIRRVEILIQDSKHDENQWKQALRDLVSKMDEMKRGFNLRSLESLEELEKLDKLDKLVHLDKLDELTHLEALEALRELQSLDMLHELKNLEQLSKLDDLRHLKELNKVEELRSLIDDFSRIVPTETFEDILAKQNDELAMLHRLDELRKLDNLIKLEDLNYLTFLGKLESLKELNNLELLDKLKSLQELNQLDQMEHLTKLDQLERLHDLDNLKDLENLRQLGKMDRLDELEKLESLRFLKELNRLDELDILRKLEELRALGELDRLRELAKLDNLERLERLNELEQLDKLETLKVLQNPKVLNAIDKIENLPLFRDKFHIYIMKSLMNSLLDFVKVAGLCVLVVYLVTTHMNRETVAKMLPYLGFGQSHRVNFAMELLADSVPREQFLRYYNYLLKRVDEQASDYFDMPAKMALTSMRSVQILDQLYSYDFTEGADGESLKNHVETVMSKGATTALKRYEEVSGYEMEKGLVSGNDKNAMHQAAIFMRNREFVKAIAEFSRIGGLDKYDSVAHGINYSIHELYREDPALVKSALDQARLVVKGN